MYRNNSSTLLIKDLFVEKHKAMIKTVTAIPESRRRTQIRGPFLFSMIAKEANHQQAQVGSRPKTLTIM